jgi:hypothetical protein
MERPYNDRQIQVLRLVRGGKKKFNELKKKLIERKLGSEATLKRDLQLFLDEGDIQYKKPYRDLAPQGEEYLKTQEPKLEAGFKDKALEKLVNFLPTEAHRSLWWCVLSSIVAKKYLLDEKHFQKYNPSYIVIGLTGDIKSLIAETICEVLGFLPIEKYVRDVSTCTANELRGRRFPIGKGDFNLNPSQYWGLPMVCLDEIDKAEGAETWRAILYFLNGLRDFEIDQTPIRHKATILAIMNPSSKWQIPPNVLRRCFVVDFTEMNLETRKMADIGEEIARYLDDEEPRLDIDNLRVNFRKLEKQDLALLKDLLYKGLKGKNEQKLVNPPTLEKLVLGYLLLKQSGDKTEAIYWAVMQNLTFLQTRGATKDGWLEELGEKWGNYIADRDPKFKEKWDKYLAKIKKEDEETKKPPIKPPIEEIPLDRVLLAKYSPKLDKLKAIKAGFVEMDGDEHGTVLLYLNMDIRKFASKLPTEKRENKVTEETLKEFTFVVEEWEGQYTPIRKAWREVKDQKEKHCRYLSELKAFLATYFGRGSKDSNGILWSVRVKEVKEDIGKALNPNTQKECWNKSFLNSISERARALLNERKQQREELKIKKAGLVTMPQLPFDLDELGEESGEFVGATTLEQIGQPIKTTRTVPYWKYLLIMLDRKLKGKGKNKPRKPRSTGYMDRSIDEL